MFQIFGALRDSMKQYLLAQILPAIKSFGKEFRIYLSLRGMMHFMALHAPIHKLYFDFDGNVEQTNTLANHDILHNQFEAVLIGDLPKTNDSVFSSNNFYIVFVGGNTMCMELNLDVMIKMHERHSGNVKILSFNPPGIGDSPGNLQDLYHYVAALNSIFCCLLEFGVPAKNIIGVGHSLGAAIVFESVCQLQAQGHDVGAFADRTLSSIAAAASAKLSNSGTFTYLMARLFAALDLNLDVAQNYKQINSFSAGAAAGIYAEGDKEMQDCCLSRGLSAEHKTGLKLFVPLSKTLNSTHSVPLNQLKSDNITAEEYLDQFVRTRFGL